MGEATLTLSPGARLWFDGRSWTVCELAANTVRLRDDVDVTRVVAVAELLGAADQLVDDVPARDASVAEQDIPAAVVLASISATARRKLEQELEILRPLLEDRGDPERTNRLSAAAGSLGVSLRTLQRRLARLEDSGPAGLVDARVLRDTRRSVDPRWDAACREVLDSYTRASTPTRKTVVTRTNRAFLEDVPDGRLPSDRVAHRRLDELDKGRYTFADAKQRRSVAKRPSGVLGQLHPTRPGQYVLLDGYRLDVFAMEPVTLRWVPTELTVAMDLYDRAITGIRLRALAAQSADVASVLFQTMTPQTWGRGDEAHTGPYAGAPEHVVLGSVGVLPDTIVVDHGKVYMSEHTRSVCRRLGVSIQPAIPQKPTDKPVLERFFRSLRQILLDKLPGYKGPDIASRGEKIEQGAFYYVTELEQLIREWVGLYHDTPHAGLTDPRLPAVDLSPTEMFNRGIASAGLLRLPDAQQLYYEFLDVAWRTIQHYGVEINGRRYDGAALNPYRGVRSNYGGVHAGKWPFMVDRDDVRVVYFRDPDTGRWQSLNWVLAGGLDAPFSADAADYTRRASLHTDRHVDPSQALEDLLARWSRQQVTDRRERNLAIRLATQKTVEAPDASPADQASLPGVIDLVARRGQQQTSPELSDDLDVFERYYTEYPDADGLEVFDE
jgi:transposase InsO family protein